MKFPEGRNTTGNHPFSTTALTKSLGAIFSANRQVTGFLRIGCGANGGYFLFFLNNSIYAAGKYFDHRPTNLTIRDLFAEVVARDPDGMTISLHETDPVLLKDFLIFFQEEPTLKAPVAMIDLYQIVEQIGKDRSNALVVLESEGGFNFYYFHDGKPAKAHYSEASPEMDGIPVDEQLLLFAGQQDRKVDAYTYLNIATREAADSHDGDQASIMSMLATVLDAAAVIDSGAPVTGEPMAKGESAPAWGKTVRICIREGAGQGASQVLNIPFMVGRKEGGLIIADPLVSRRHAIVKDIGGSLVIEDLGSTNGTFVNGVGIKLQQLAAGDLVRVGSCIFQVLAE